MAVRWWITYHRRAVIGYEASAIDEGGNHKMTNPPKIFACGAIDFSMERNKGGKTIRGGPSEPY